MREELLRGAFISWLVVGVLSNFWGELLAGGAAGKPPKHGGGESTQHARLHSLCAKTATSFEFATEPVTKIQPIDLHNPIKHTVYGICTAIEVPTTYLHQLMSFIGHEKYLFALICISCVVVSVLCLNREIARVGLYVHGRILHCHYLL